MTKPNGAITTALPPEPPLGRKVTELARIYGGHPSRWIRAIRKPKRLRGGGSVSLAAVYDGGAYRVKDSDVASYLDALTADRLGRSAQPALRSPAAATRAYEAAERELDAAGL